jgi:FkbM family methyltransferase
MVLTRSTPVENLRKWVRDRVGYKSWAYRLASEVLNQVLIFSSVGPRMAVQLLRIRMKRQQEEVSIDFPMLQYPFLIRSKTTDLETVINNFIRREYGQLPRDFSPRVIVDAGAYIGDTSAYFLTKYPKAHVIALEPAPESFRLAARNLSPYGKRVTLRQAALGPTRGNARISGIGTGARISELGEDIAITTVADLLEGTQDGRIDLLKMDIEGAEREVLCTTAIEWLDRIDMIIVETHGDEIERDVLAVLDSHGWERWRHRNLWYCRNISRSIEWCR